MNASFVRVLCVAAALAASSLVGFAQEAKPKLKLLVDFRQQYVERIGGDVQTTPKFEYGFGTWDKKTIFLEGKGVLVPALSGQGGIGTNERLKFGPNNQAVIQLVIGNRNQAEAVSLGLVDADGTEASWNLPLKGQPVGESLTFMLPLTQPTTETKPGKKPGLDLARLKTWQLRGNWQEAPTEVLFISIGMLAP